MENIQEYRVENEQFCVTKISPAYNVFYPLCWKTINLKSDKATVYTMSLDGEPVYYCLSDNGENVFFLRDGKFLNYFSAQQVASSFTEDFLSNVWSSRELQGAFKKLVNALDVQKAYDIQLDH